MNSANPDLDHLMSFRRGDISKIDVAKRYFDDLSANPPVFLARMFTILKID